MVSVREGSVSAEDGVTLLLDRLLDRAHLDPVFVEGDSDRGIGDGDLDGLDAVQGTHRAFDARLAVIAVDLRRLEKDFTHVAEATRAQTSSITKESPGP